MSALAIVVGVLGAVLAYAWGLVQTIDLVPLRSVWASVWDAGRVIVTIGILIGLGWISAGCAPSLELEVTQDIANERARYQCELARVPVESMPACIMREVASRREHQLLGAWSPI